MSSNSPTAAPTKPVLNQVGRVRNFGFVLSILVGLAILCCGALVFRNRKTRVIKVHQPLFLITICVGLFLWAMSVIPMSLDDSILSQQGCDRSCMAAEWLLTLGYSTSFSALYAKLYRINKLFRGAAQYQRVRVEAKDVLWAFFAICTINCSILLAWTFVDPLRWVREPINDTEPWNTYGLCKSSGSAGEAFAAAIGLVNFIALIMVCVQSWKARHISVEFNEAKYLSIALYNWLQLQLVSVPTKIALRNENSHASYILNVSVLLMMTLSMLLILFVPILQQLRRYNRSQQRESHTTNITIPGGHVHVTGLRTSNNEESYVPSLSNIGGHPVERNAAEMSTDEEGGGAGFSTVRSDNTEIKALKNRISMLEEEVRELDEITQKNVILAKRIEELEEQRRTEDNAT